jgi:hypothetical protein
MDGSIIVPGLAPEMTNDAYHSSAGTSKSALDDMAPPNAPIHYWHNRINPDREQEEKTPALILGDAIHKAVLEPDLMEKHFITIPEDAPKRPSISQINAKKPSLESQGAIAYWRDFQVEAAGKIIMKPDDMQMVMDVRDAVHRHPLAKGLFTGGKAEQTYFAIDPTTSELIKCRVDYDRLEDVGMFVDLKTTEDASPEGFGRSANKYRYHVQGGWYPHVVHSAYQQTGIVESFVFVAVEKSPPYAIGVYYLEPDWAADGLDEGMEDLRRIKACRDANHWPDFAEQALPLQRPTWTRHRA